MPKKISVALTAEEICQQLMKYDLKGKLKSSYECRESTSLGQRSDLK